MTPVGLVVLAAGRSRRFGGGHKLLAALHGVPLLWHALEAACAAPARPIVIVVGHRQRAIRATLARFRRARRRVPPWRVVYNPHHAGGMAGSLQLGLAALPARCTGAVVLLGDMPDVRATTIARLCAAHAPGAAAVVPRCEGRRGNPVLLGRTLFAAVAGLRGDEGARRLLARAADVRTVEVPRGGFADVDTRRDWHRARARRR